MVLLNGRRHRLAGKYRWLIAGAREWAQANDE
jgi:hypothetical protein